MCVGRRFPLCVPPPPVLAYLRGEPVLRAEGAGGVDGVLDGGHAALRLGVLPGRDARGVGRQHDGLRLAHAAAPGEAVEVIDLDRRIKGIRDMGSIG